MAAAVVQPVDVMRRALELAAQGQGRVEPNPPVGAVVVDDRMQLISEGRHEQFGGPHAEVVALDAAGERARGATLFVTLEPCAHVGQTPPCAPRIIAAGVRKVVVCTADPAPHTAGRGLQLLRDAGIDVEVGLLGDAGRRLIAPFTKLMTRGLPWVHAKWAMTLDGRLATRTGNSQWISSEESRRVVHELRGRMDAVIVGIGTAIADDPQLTARPAGPRTPVRIVVDSNAQLPLESQLVQTARETPVLLAVADAADAERCARLRDSGVEVVTFEGNRAHGSPGVRLDQLLAELGSRRITQVLVEGGPLLLGSFFDARLIDEVHAFIAPCLVGGDGSYSAMLGAGVDFMSEAVRLCNVDVTQTGGDVYVHGDVPHGDI